MTLDRVPPDQADAPRAHDVASTPGAEHPDQGLRVLSDRDRVDGARDIPFHSLCRHHLLPFVGVAHIGDLPDERILGLSKLARVVEGFSRSLQTQERMTNHVAGWIAGHPHPKGVGLALEAEHLCMTLRGAGARGATTTTSALQGLVREDARTRQEFLALARAGSAA